MLQLYKYLQTFDSWYCNLMDPALYRQWLRYTSANGLEPCLYLLGNCHMPGLVLLGLLSSNLYSGCFWIFPHTSSYFTILQQSGLRSFQPSLALVPRSDVRDIRQPPASPAAREPTPHWHLWVLLVHPTKSFLTMDWVTGWVWWENLRLKHVETMVLYMVLCWFFSKE